MRPYPSRSTWPDIPVVQIDTLPELILVWAGWWRQLARNAFTLASVAVAFVLLELLQGACAGFHHRGRAPDKKD